MPIAVSIASSFSYFVRRRVEADIKKARSDLLFYNIAAYYQISTEREIPTDIGELLHLNKHCYNDDRSAYDFSNGVYVDIPTDLFKFI